MGRQPLSAFRTFKLTSMKLTFLGKDREREHLSPSLSAHISNPKKNTNWLEFVVGLDHMLTSIKGEVGLLNGPLYENLVVYEMNSSLQGIYAN